MAPNQIYKFSHSKGNINQTERQPMELEKIFANNVTHRS